MKSLSLLMAATLGLTGAMASAQSQGSYGSSPSGTATPPAATSPVTGASPSDHATSGSPTGPSTSAPPSSSGASMSGGSMSAPGTAAGGSMSAPGTTAGGMSGAGPSGASPSNPSAAAPSSPTSAQAPAPIVVENKVDLRTEPGPPQDLHAARQEAVNALHWARTEGCRDDPSPRDCVRRAQDDYREAMARLGSDRGGDARGTVSASGTSAATGSSQRRTSRGDRR